ncbi:MAG TPA: hypothetical protein VN733_04765 [Solirubrobacterales bacterium]|nr:hypothetical protein [Solirubrobacterales bacterium]
MRWAWAIAGLAAAALILAGCGGSDSDPSSEATAPPLTAAHAREANATCEEMLRRTKVLGQGFIERASGATPRTLLELQTELLVQPGLDVLRDTARRFRRIAAESGNPELSLYAGLYEPLIQVGELRLQAGREGDPAESQNLQRQMEEIGAEQRQLAVALGLESCRIDFLRALVESWSS